MNIKKVLLLFIQMTLLTVLFAGCSGMLDVPGKRTAAGDAPVTSIGDAPVPGTEVTFSGTDSTSTTVSWGPATDTETTDAELQYRVVTASSLEELDTIPEALALDGASIVRDWSTDTGSLDITGLTNGTTYWYAVLVKDSAGNVTLYDPRAVKIGESVTAVADNLTDNLYVGIATTITTSSLLLNDSNNIGDDGDLKIVEIKSITNGTVTPAFAAGDNEIIFSGTAEGTATFIYTVQAGADASTKADATVTLNIVEDNPPLRELKYHLPILLPLQRRSPGDPEPMSRQVHQTLSTRWSLHPPLKHLIPWQRLMPSRDLQLLVTGAMIPDLRISRD